MDSLSSPRGEHEAGWGEAGEHVAHRVHEEWVLPRTRREADERILELSHDISLILAQLAEDQASWSGRTGRDAVEYLAWRRRALFAKAHKEHQLRDCKRVRAELAGRSSVAVEGGAASDALAELTRRCRVVIGAWHQGLCENEALEEALTELARWLAPLSAAGNR